FFGGTSAATPQTAALVALVNAARTAQGKQPIGFLDPLLYGGVGAADYTDIVSKHYGSAPKTFAGAEVGVGGPVFMAAGAPQDKQWWRVRGAVHPPPPGCGATPGWEPPPAQAFVSPLAVMRKHKRTHPRAGAAWQPAASKAAATPARGHGQLAMG